MGHKDIQLITQCEVQISNKDKKEEPSEPMNKSEKEDIEDNIPCNEKNISIDNELKENNQQLEKGQVTNFLDNNDQIDDFTKPQVKEEELIKEEDTVLEENKQAEEQTNEEHIKKEETVLEEDEMGEKLTNQ